MALRKVGPGERRVAPTNATNGFGIYIGGVFTTGREISFTRRQRRE
jgi:hypothetical protein